MTSRTRRIGLAILCCSVVIAPEIWAFFPIGIYDSAGVLRYRKYRINDFDNNNDGQIAEDEGIEVLLEGGRSGFTEAELNVLREAFAVWKRIPQSYASFHEVGVFLDPVVADGQSDFQNTIVMFVPNTVDLDGDGLPDENVVPDDPGTVVQPTGGVILGYNISTWTGEDTIIDTPSESYLVSAGTIIDNDLVIDAGLHRPQVLGEEPAAELLGTVVHELGHFLGLEHTLLNNLSQELTDPSNPLGGDRLVESAALVHSIGGVKYQIGVTPTMFPLYFQVATDNGDRIDGGSDLAPDEISAMAWLYPRGSQDLFFRLNGEARTHTRPGTGLPSIAIASGHVVAWADADNDPTTPRVPMFSGLTGFYEHPENRERDGRFELLGMWKTMETESGIFNASYTYSLSPINGSGYTRQAPPGFDASIFGDLAIPRADAFTAYSSEVFHEVSNIVDVSNKDAGTPLVWDFQRSALVSVDTERSIEKIVGADPIFGDPNDVCILNVVGAAGAGGGAAGLSAAAEHANSVRSLRDGLLLETPLGSFIVDTYYKISPAAARFILGNKVAYDLTVGTVNFAYWCLNHGTAIFLFLAAVCALLFARIRLRKRAVVAGAGIVAMALLVAAPADARILYLTTEQLVAGASEVISGQVVSATPRKDPNSLHVYTDIVVSIEDKAKGTLNKQSNVTFSQIGGRLGGLVTKGSEFPDFEVGEEVVLYLLYVEDFGYIVYNGIGGKTVVSVNVATGAKTVKLPADIRAKKAKDLKPGETVPEKVSLSEYMDELKAIAKAQAKTKR